MNPPLVTLSGSPVNALFRALRFFVRLARLERVAENAHNLVRIFFRVHEMKNLIKVPTDKIGNPCENRAGNRIYQLNSEIGIHCKSGYRETVQQGLKLVGGVWSIIPRLNVHGVVRRALAHIREPRS